MNILPFLAPYFEQYLTLERVHPSRTYNYAKRGVLGSSVIEVTQHGPKCRQGESWLYIAAPLRARLDALASDEKLYVGAQTQDRMFRGDGLDGNNYHHAEMRAGNADDNPLTYLRSGRRISIHRISASAIAMTVVSTPELCALIPLLHQPKTPRKHIGYWFEQFILLKEAGVWRWNTASADKAVARILAANNS